MPSFPLHILKWAAACAVAWAGTASAAGLGPISVHTGFGQPLRATVALLGEDTEDFEGRCIRARIETIDNGLLFSPEVGISRGKGAARIHLSTHQNVNELALNISVQLTCGTPVQRSYQILLDPVSSLPVVSEEKTSDKPAQSQRAVPAQNMAESAGGEGKPRARAKARQRTSAEGNASATGSERPVAPVAEKRKTRKETQSERPVLKLSSADMYLSNDAGVNPDNLRMSDTLSMPSIDPDPKRLADLKAAQAQLTAFLRDENLVQSSEAKLKAAQAEIETLKAERERLRHAQRTEATALENAKNSTNGWLLGLQVLLVLFIAATAWLLWRFYLLKKRESNRAWEELLSDQDTRNFFSSSQLNENSDFHTSQFATSGFGDTDFSNTDFNNTIDTEALGTPTGGSIQGTTPQAPADTPAESAPPSRPRAPAKKRRIPSRPGAQPEQSLRAEEISDVMELADAWMTLQNPAKVLEILEPFSSVDQPESPLPWLCLLDVYRALGDRKKYEAILERIKKIYNVKLAPWDPVVDAEPPKSLSDFPHIIDNVQRLWGTEAVITYLDKLLLDNREGTRNGFDLPVYRDILRLLDLANDPNGPKTREEIVREIELRTTTHRSMHAQPQPAAPAVAQAGANSPAAKPAAAESEDTAPRKPLLRERPKYITTSYHRKIAKPTIYIPDDAAPIPSSLLSEPETVNNPLPEILLADERSITESHVAESVAAHQQAVEPRAATQEPVSEYDEMSPIAIKLHLAIAYQDIGDRDGARLLLDEVIQGGTPEQVEQAKELLTKLG